MGGGQLRRRVSVSLAIPPVHGEVVEGRFARLGERKVQCIRVTLGYAGRAGDDRVPRVSVSRGVSGIGWCGLIGIGIRRRDPKIILRTGCQAGRLVSGSVLPTESKLLKLMSSVE